MAEEVLDRMTPALRHALAALMPSRAVDASVSTRIAVAEPDAWQRERLVLAVAAFLSRPARTRPTLVVIEDLHWADPFTLDLLTYLVAGTRTGATLVATLRTDQWPMPPSVLETVAELQRLQGTATVELGPLPANVVAEQVEELLGRESSPQFVTEVVELSGGNPFFAEQLCRHAATGGSAVPGTLPPRLSGFLQSRIRTVSAPARRALLLLAVAGTPLSAAELAAAAEVSDRDSAELVRELSEATLLAPGGQGRVAPRHALLSAAVVQTADPVAVAWAHAQIGTVFDVTRDPVRVVASAAHWAAAGREREELHATLAAGPVAEELADFNLAAEMWQRAFELALKYPDEADEKGISALRISVCALEAANRAGRTEEGIALAEVAFTQFASLEETYLGGTLRWWIGLFRSYLDRAAGAAMMTDAARVLSDFAPSAPLARCLSSLARFEEQSGRPDRATALAERGLQIARSCGSTYAEALTTVALGQALVVWGRAREAIERAVTLAERPDVAADARARSMLAMFESDLHLRSGKLEQARLVAWSAYELLEREGYGSTFEAAILRYNCGEAQLELGRTARVRELVESVTTDRLPSVRTTGDHLLRALVDLNEGEVQAGLDRIELVSAISRMATSTEDARLTAQGAATILLWAGLPEQALTSVMTDLEVLVGTDQQSRCGELLTLGAAAAADLCSQATARGDVEGRARADRALERLSLLAGSTEPSPFESLLEGGREGVDGQQWNAEVSRATGRSDPELWRRVARQWEEQSRAHRAAYCWWRCAQSEVDHGAPPSKIFEALQRAYELSEEMQPVRAGVSRIALRAHISLTTRPAPAHGEPSPDLPVALTQRELEILRHVAAGRSNAQIAHDLFISPKTVSVHVSNLLRKIGVGNRLQAADWAEQVGVLTTTRDRQL